VFCLDLQIEDEVSALFDFMQYIYGKFHLELSSCYQAALFYLQEHTEHMGAILYLPPNTLWGYGQLKKWL
jgi:hypothetical protein